MSDDAGRPRAVPHGNAGPADPNADPRTDPGLAVAAPGEQATGPVAVPPGPPPPAPGPADETPVRRSRTGGLWVGLIASALVLLLLLVFIVQNDAQVLVRFFALEALIPLGVALLLAAIAGILLVAIPGSLRILQLRRAARRGAQR